MPCVRRLLLCSMDSIGSPESIANVPPSSWVAFAGCWPVSISVHSLPAPAAKSWLLRPHMLGSERPFGLIPTTTTSKAYRMRQLHLVILELVLYTYFGSIGRVQRRPEAREDPACWPFVEAPDVLAATKLLCQVCSYYLHIDICNLPVASVAKV